MKDTLYTQLKAKYHEKEIKQKNHRTQYHIKDDEKIKRNQKIFENDSNEVRVKRNPKKKQLLKNLKIFFLFVLVVNKTTGVNLLEVVFFQIF